MTEFEPQLLQALREQLSARRRVLEGGARHIGWKLGVGERESIGGAIAVGYLTSATLLPPGSAYRAQREAQLHADAEAVVELRSDIGSEAEPDEAAGAIAAYGGALEIVDLAPVAGEPEAVIASNVFHRAVSLVAVADRAPADLEVRIAINGAVLASEPWPSHLPVRLAKAARLLAAAGERLRAGDRIITGSIVQVPIAVGDLVVASFGELAAVSLTVVGPMSSGEADQARGTVGP